MSEQSSGFGRELRRAREAAGVGRTELARRVDLNQSYLYRLEAGGRRPSRKTVVALAAALRLGRAETEAWLKAAGHEVNRSAGGGATAARGVRPAIPTSGTLSASGGNNYELEGASQLEAGFAALGVDVGTMHRLLDAAETLSGVERRRLAEHVDGAFIRLAHGLSAPARTVLIPVVHPRLSLLAPHVVQHLVVRTIQEAVSAGADRIVLVAAEGTATPWHGALRAAIGVASVPRVELALVEMGASASGGLGLAVLRAEEEIGDRPFGVLAPEVTPSPPTGSGVAFSAFGRMSEVFGRLRTGGDAYLLAVSGRPEGTGSPFSVVTGEEVLPSVYRVTRIQPQPERAIGDGRRASPAILRSAAGRYVFGPGILDALHEAAADAGGEPSIADALEHLRRGGSDVYAMVLPGARRSVVTRLDDLAGAVEEATPGKSP